MPLDIQGVRYFSASEILGQIGVTRQTLWRWRQEEKIPPGQRYRDGKVLFTTEQVEQIKEFANRIEPIGGSDQNQLTLFNGRRALD